VKAIIGTFKTVLGLFVDDGTLALAILALLVWVALLAQSGLVVSSAILMLVLVGGTLLLLLENVTRSAGRR
jgi:hypothetical protein